MIEFFLRQSRRVRRTICLAATLTRNRAEAVRLGRSGSATSGSRVRFLQAWCAATLAAIDIQVEVEGIPPTRGLLVSNHLSYLDILVCSSVTPSAFVSKAEVARWPIFGRLAKEGGTIFVEREDRSAARRVTQEIAENLRAGVAVVLFPEGTTTDGSHILRFHPSMFQSAIEARVEVTPCAISYTVPGGSEQDVAWWGDMMLAPHVWKVLGQRLVVAKVIFGEPIAASLARRELSDRAREQVVALREQLLVGTVTATLRR